MLQNEGVQTFLSKDPEVWAVVHAKWHAFVLNKYLSLQTEEEFDATTTADETDDSTATYVPDGSLHNKTVPDYRSHTNNVVSALDTLRKVERKAYKFSEELYKVFCYWASNNMDTFENATEDFMQWLNANQDQIVTILRINQIWLEFQSYNFLRVFLNLRNEMVEL